MNRFANLRPRTWLMLTVFAVLVGLVLAQAPGVSAAVKQISRLAIPTIPATMNYQGILRNTDGTLTNGTFSITARVYDQATDGNLYYNETFNNVNVRDGLFNIVLGDITPLGTTFEGAPRFIGITLNGGSELTPRERVHGVPWAIYATNSLNATNATNATNAINATNATNAAFATNASNATNATNAQNAAEADAISGMDSVRVTADARASTQLVLDLPFVQDDSRGMCFLYHVETVSGTTRCYIDYSADELVAGAGNKCVALCMRWDGASIAGFGIESVDFTKSETQTEEAAP